MVDPVGTVAATTPSLSADKTLLLRVPGTTLAFAPSGSSIDTRTVVGSSGDTIPTRTPNFVAYSESTQLLP